MKHIKYWILIRVIFLRALMAGVMKGYYVKRAEQNPCTYYQVRVIQAQRKLDKVVADAKIIDEQMA